MTNTLSGTIVEISATQVRTATSSGKEFKTREFVITFNDVVNGVESQYPNYAKFQLVQDKCAVLDSYRQGDKITVSYNIKGSKYINKEGKEAYITNLQAWRIERNGATPQAPEPQAPTGYLPNPVTPPANQPIDDLPF